MSYKVPWGEWTMPVGRYRLLRPAELKKIGEPTNQIAICIKNNKIIALATLDTTKRGLYCDNCTNKCAVGFMAWVREGDRGNGIIGDLFSWFGDQIGVTGPLYVSPAEKIDPVLEAVFWTQGLKLPKDFKFTPGQSQLENEQKTTAYVNRISTLLGFDV